MDQIKGWNGENSPQLLQKVYTVSRVVCVIEGDPYVSGLYNIVGEEILSRGISFEVVPGIPSLLAAPSYIGLSTSGKKVEKREKIGPINAPTSSTEVEPSWRNGDDFRNQW